MDQLSPRVEVKGRPERLDTVLRPFAFAVLVGTGLIGSGILVYLGMWFWVPVPAAAGVLIHQAIFAIRGDRPIRCQVEGGVLTAVDPKAQREHRLDLSTVRYAGVSARQVDHSDRDIAYFVFYSDSAPVLALRMSTPRRAWARHTVPLDALQPVLGGNAGVLRGLAPADRLIRQVLDDADGELAAALLEHIDASAWEARPIRVWAGQAPPVDFMGLHQGPPDAILLFREEADGAPVVEVLDGPGPATVEPGVHPITGTEGARASRLLSLLSMPGQDARMASLPVIVWEITGAHRLAIPAPIAGHHGQEVELDERALHTHLGEGAGAIWWLSERLQRIPDSLRQAISDSRVASPHLHPGLARHLPDGGLTPSDSPETASPSV